MKKIGLLSDTHGFLDPKVFKYFEHCDEVWHAGDIGSPELLTQLEKFKPTKAVLGNIDGASLKRMCPKIQYFMCEELKVIILHIGGYPGRYNPLAQKLIAQYKPNIFVCGHSHILKIIYDKKNDHLHLNPGAAGNYGFHQVKTLLRFTVDGKDIKDMEIVELGGKSNG